MSENMKVQDKSLVDIFRKGGIKLLKPILANDKEHTELRFDFGLLTGWDFVNAMDSDFSGKSNAYRLTSRQAFALFAAAVSKCIPDIDAEDLRQRMSVDDCIKATQVAVSFFNASSMAGNERMLS